MRNIFLIMLIITGVAGGIIYYFKANKSKYLDYDIDEDKYQLDTILEYIKNTFNDILKTNLYSMNITREEFEKRVQNKNELRKALKTCIYGDINAKNYVKNYIRDILLKTYKIDESNIDKIMNFNSAKELSIQDKFEILLYVYKKKHDLKALEMLLEENTLDNAKGLEEGNDGDGIRYAITSEEIEQAYIQKVKRLTSFDDKLNVIVQRLYQRYKGYGVIDEIRDMKIDGVSGGVSGIPSSFFQQFDYNGGVLSSLPMSYDSVWIFFKGKTIHLEFLSFGSEQELIRVCKNIYRYNNPGQLSETNGYKVNEMKDGSRVVVARPPFCESWVFFVRKFDSAENKEPEDLITDKNSKLAIDCMKWLVKGCRVTAVTGFQGTGKTTLLMSIVKFINYTFTLRIQEMAFELHLRKLYPKRNIVSFRETSTVSGQEGLDLQKKTDGTVNIMGEVATAPVASWMIQMAQVASLFTIFTHHAKTSSDLVLALRNNLLQTRVFSNEKVAERQVAEVVNFDIHLYKDISGHRYIQRITEIIPVIDESDYPETYKEGKTQEETMRAFADTVKEYFTRVTDRKTFETRDIIVWDNGEYKVANPISKKSFDEICSHLNEEEKDEFNLFLKEGWGVAYE
ncbi:P-loop NTPase family protein [Acetivibrio cellulolyticus]|uniref:ATPase, T2SS/T4P/T4SS family n=1 Tax=Acetivibrio cellulolyticus TaxID=35830 RepID=UPI0001E2F0EB|nr:ATPase, T2SS/T4P/T4SS family [Acetivibrio cellulolyticus]